jgi:hypothetical protein
LGKTAYDGRMTKRPSAFALLALASVLAAWAARAQSGRAADAQKTQLDAPGISIPIDVREQ